MQTKTMNGGNRTSNASAAELDRQMQGLSMSAYTLQEGVSALAELVSVYADGACHDDPARTTQQLHGLSALLSLTGAHLLDHCETLGQVEALYRGQCQHPG